MLTQISVVLSAFLIASIPNTTIYVAEPQEITHFVVRTTDMRLLTDFYAEKWNVSKEVMHWVVDCESDYDPNAVGDGGDSFGLSQIHLPSWDGKITEGEARDPDFALNFLGQKLSEGQGRLWTCYKKKYT